MSDLVVGSAWEKNAVVEVRMAISPAGLLSIAAIVLAGAVVTGVAIREARRPRRSRDTGNGSGAPAEKTADRIA